MFMNIQDDTKWREETQTFSTYRHFPHNLQPIGVESFHGVDDPQDQTGNDQSSSENKKTNDN